MNDIAKLKVRPRVLSSLLVIPLIVGCNGKNPNAPPYDSGPPDGGSYNPVGVPTPNGTGGASGYGYGSGSGVGPGEPQLPDAGPPECPVENRRCANEFTFTAGNGNETSVELRGNWKADLDGNDIPDSWEVGLPMTKDGNVWRVTLNLPMTTQVQYKFVVKGTGYAPTGTWMHDPNQPMTPPETDGNINNVKTSVTCEKAEWICEEPEVPADVFDWRDAIIYFPMVDRFANGDGRNDCRVSDGRVAELANYQGGDWKGITQKIQEGYFEQLGINTIWLSVPLDNAEGPDEGVNGGDGSPNGKFFTGYHAYWPRDPDPNKPYRCFGTQAELKEMVAAAKAKNMKLLVDYAMVHVHRSSPAFEAGKSKGWFWMNGDQPHSICYGGLWEVFREEGGNFIWDPEAPGNKCWFTPMLAHWNFGNTEARDYVVQNVIDWVKAYDFDGLRLDAIKHVHMDWLTELRKKINSDILPLKKKGQRFYLLGETYDGNPAKLKVHVDPKTKLDGQFDFALQPAIRSVMLRRQGSMSDLKAAVDVSEGWYGPGVIMSTFFGNHDQDRSIHEAGGAGSAEAFEKMANAFAVLFTIKGAPSVLYGDEIGMEGIGDPGARGVMRFDGLSAEQAKLRERVGKLAKIRAQNAALRRGTRETIIADGDLWFFKMSTTGNEVWVAINRGDGTRSISGLPAGSTELLTETPVPASNFDVPPRQSRIFVKK